MPALETTFDRVATSWTSVWSCWHSTVVRTSVCDRRTFPGLRHDVQLTGDLLGVNHSLYVSQHGQLSHSSSWIDEWVVSWTQAFAMHICVVAPPGECLWVKADCLQVTLCGPYLSAFEAFVKTCYTNPCYLSVFRAHLCVVVFDVDEVVVCCRVTVQWRSEHWRQEFRLILDVKCCRWSQDCRCQRRFVSPLILCVLCRSILYIYEL